MHTESIRVAHHERAVACTCWWPDSSAPVPAVILSHGYNGTADDLASRGQHLARRGIAAICLTFCGGSNRDTSGFPTTAMTLFTERDDILAVLEHATADPRVSRVFLYGESMGGMASVLASAQAPKKIAGLGLLYPALCIPDNWRETFPEVADIPETVDFWGMPLGRGFFTSIRELDIFQVLPAYRGPVLLMHGTRDDIVPLAYSERAAVLCPSAALHVFPGEGHGFSDAGSQKVCDLLTQFVLDHS